MIKLSLVLSLIFCSLIVQAQVRVSKLVVRPSETYVMDSTDIIVADTLIMMDSSVIRLNGLKPDNFIRTKVAIFGKHCLIDGRGIKGNKGTEGAHGITPVGPCKDGLPGRNGLRGLTGGPGVNLFLYVDHIEVKGQLIIDISGGSGGDGGNGGHGGGGSSGTQHCYGGDGGDGGNGGAGGDGGRGGVLTVGGLDAMVTKALLGNLILVKNHGGAFGYGGVRGSGGLPGLGPGRKHGRPGQNGKDGLYGRPGDGGAIRFQEP
jgi:hypothetical protein